MRKRSSKEIFADTLLELSQKKTVDKITVQQIVDESGLSLQTFYNHFKDKADLILWVHKSKFEELLSKLGKDGYTFHDLINENKIMAESDEEWEEAKKVNARLIELGEMPEVEIEKYPIITDEKEMLEYDCKESAEALPMMGKALALCDDDYVTKAMIQQFIIDEQEHYNWVRTDLCIIEQFGLENYLLLQLGE